MRHSRPSRILNFWKSFKTLFKHCECVQVGWLQAIPYTANEPIFVGASLTRPIKLMSKQVLSLVALSFDNVTSAEKADDFKSINKCQAIYSFFQTSLSDVPVPENHEAHGDTRQVLLVRRSV